MASIEQNVRETEDVIDIATGADDMFRLGLIYSTDREDRGPDFIEAHKWFSLAAMLGSLPAKAYREELKHEMSALDLTLAQRAARGWLAENREVLSA